MDITALVGIKVRWLTSTPLGFRSRLFWEGKTANFVMNFKLPNYTRTLLAIFTSCYEAASENLFPALGHFFLKKSTITANQSTCWIDVCGWNPLLHICQFQILGKWGHFEGWRSLLWQPICGFFARFLSILRRAFYLWRLAIGLLTILILDIDECESRDSNRCDPNALCTNVEGFYICRCLRGYQGDGQFCVGEVNGVASNLVLVF